MTTTWVDFKQLKADVGIELLLVRYGVRLRRIGATELRGRCQCPRIRPRGVATVSPSTSRAMCGQPSLSCMQARGGRPGGNILDLVALMEGCSIRDAALRVHTWSGAAPEHFVVAAAIRAHPVAPTNPPLRFTLQIHGIRRMPTWRLEA